MKSIYLAIASTVGILATSLSAQAATLSTSNNPPGNGFNELFGTISRIGILEGGPVGGADFEQAILQPVNLVDEQGEFIWVSGQTVNFSLEFDGSNVVYNVNAPATGDVLAQDITLSSDTFSGPVTDLIFRTRAEQDSEVSLTNLRLTDNNNMEYYLPELGSIGSAGMLLDTDGVQFDQDFLQVSGVSGPFSVAGEAVLTFDPAQPPIRSALVFQIGAGTTESVPEPASVMAIALVVGAASLKLRRCNS